MSRSNAWPFVIIVLAFLASVAAETNTGLLLVRAPVALAFLLLCPGMAFVRFLGLRRASVEVTLAIALSLVLDTLVSEGMVLAGVWTMGASLKVLVFLSVAGAVLQIVVSALRDEETADA